MKNIIEKEKKCNSLRKGTVFIFSGNGFFSTFILIWRQQELETSHNVVGVRVEYEIKGRKRFDNEFSKEEKRAWAIFSFSFFSFSSSLVIALNVIVYIYFHNKRSIYIRCIYRNPLVRVITMRSRRQRLYFQRFSSVTVRAYSHSFLIFFDIIVNVLFYYSLSLEKKKLPIILRIIKRS